MTSEIRANTLKNRVGLGTIEYSNTGPVISGVTTSNNFKTGSTNVHSVGVEAAGINVLGADTPIGTGATIYNSGAAVFTGVVTATSFSGTVKATNLTSDRVVFTTTNGQLEASGNLTYNGTTLASGSPVDINADLDVDGHTNLDNISIAGVTTSNSRIHFPSESVGAQIRVGDQDDFQVEHDGSNTYLANSTGDLVFQNDASIKFTAKTGGTERLRIDSSGNVRLMTSTQNSYPGFLANSNAVNFTLGSTAGAEPRIYLFGSGNGQSNAKNISLLTGSSTGDINMTASKTTITSQSNEEIFRIETSAGNPGGTSGKSYMGFDHFSGSTKPAILIGSDEVGNASYMGNFVVKLKDSAATDDDPVERMRIDQHGRMWINSGGTTTPTQDYKTINTVATPTYEAGITFSRSHVTMGGGNSGGKTIMLSSDASLLFNTHNVGERMRIDSSGRVVVGGTSAYIGGAALAVLGTGTTPNTYGSFAIGKIGANPTSSTTLANIRLNGGSAGTRRGAEINAVTNGNWTDGSSHPTNLTFAVAKSGSASVSQRLLINSHGHFQVTNENVFPASGSAGTNGFKGLTQLGYQHWGQRQYYSGQVNLTQNQHFDLFSNNTAHVDIIFWLNIRGYHSNRTFATAHGTIGGYGMSVSYTSASGVYGSFSGVNIGTGREVLRWTSTTPNNANWWIWGWYSGATGTGTHTGHSAAQLH